MMVPPRRTPRPGPVPGSTVPPTVRPMDMRPQPPVAVIPANAGVHGFDRLPERAIAGGTPSMGPGGRRDDGPRWAMRYPDTQQHPPEYPQ